MHGDTLRFQSHGIHDLTKIFNGFTTVFSTSLIVTFVLVSSNNGYSVSPFAERTHYHVGGYSTGTADQYRSYNCRILCTNSSCHVSCTIPSFPTHERYDMQFFLNLCHFWASLIHRSIEKIIYNSAELAVSWVSDSDCLTWTCICADPARSTFYLIHYSESFFWIQCYCSIRTIFDTHSAFRASNFVHDRFFHSHCIFSRSHNNTSWGSCSFRLHDCFCNWFWTLGCTSKRHTNGTRVYWA